MNQQELFIKSTLDGTMQPSLFFKSPSKEKRPLLVGLHTWSYNRFNQIDNMLPVAEQYDFNLLLPEFRGSNLAGNPHCREACGSVYARQDIKDAIDYLVAAGEVDESNIFLLGLSGGGHMALLMAGMCPNYFKAIGAFVPITDLAAWSEENQDYARHVLACCETKEEMWQRSPMAHLETIAKANLKLFHGKYDPIVPVAHSLRLFQSILNYDPTASVYLDIFDGGHEIDMQTAMYWLLSQYRPSEKIVVTG